MNPQARGIALRLRALGLGLFIQLGSACAQAPDPEGEPDRPASSPPQTQEPSEGSARTPCPGPPAGFGRPLPRPGWDLPGPVVAQLVWDAQLWVCGQDAQGGGYLLRVGADETGEVERVDAFSLAAPCRGLTRQGNALAIWLRGGALQRWADDMLQEEVLTLAPNVNGDAALKSWWDPDAELFYVAAGDQGLLRLAVRDGTLVRDPQFQVPELQVQDLVAFERWLVLADPQRGVVLWDRAQQRQVGQWRDPDREGWPLMRGLALQGSSLAVSAGAAGAYLLSLQARDDQPAVELLAAHTSDQPVVSAQSLQGQLLWASARAVGIQDATLFAAAADLNGDGLIRAISASSDGALWVARGPRIERWVQTQPQAQPRLGISASFASLNRVDGLRGTAEYRFTAGGTEPLWVARPQLVQSDGLVLNIADWGAPVPVCKDLYRFSPGSSFSVQVRARDSIPTPRRTQLVLRTNDPDQARVAIDLDVFAATLASRVGQPLPAIRLSHACDASIGPGPRQGGWQWIEFVGAQELNEAARRAALGDKIRRLDTLVDQERRNGRNVLSVALVVAGRCAADDLRALLQDQGLAWRPRVEVYLDPTFRSLREYANAPSGRFFPLRVLVDPEGVIREIDQLPGMATMTARYRELKFR